MQLLQDMDLDTLKFLKESLLEGDRADLDKVEEDIRDANLKLEFLRSPAWKVFTDLIDENYQTAIQEVAKPEAKLWHQGYLYAQIELKAWALGIEPYLRRLEQQRAEALTSVNEEPGGIE